MPDVTRLEVLQDARRLAEAVGVVEDGGDFFDVRNGDRHSVAPYDVLEGRVQPEKVCGVCIIGACLLAKVLAGDDTSTYEWEDDARNAAYDVLGSEDEYEGTEALTRAIDDKGLPYVLAVLDRMVEREREAATA